MMVRMHISVMNQIHNLRFDLVDHFAKTINQIGLWKCVQSYSWESKFEKSLYPVRGCNFSHFRSLFIKEFRRPLRRMALSRNEPVYLIATFYMPQHRTTTTKRLVVRVN